MTISLNAIPVEELIHQQGAVNFDVESLAITDPKAMVVNLDSVLRNGGFTDWYARWTPGDGSGVTVQLTGGVDFHSVPLPNLIASFVFRNCQRASGYRFITHHGWYLPLSHYNCNLVLGGSNGPAVYAASAFPSLRSRYEEFNRAMHCQWGGVILDAAGPSIPPKHRPMLGDAERHAVIWEPDWSKETIARDPDPYLLRVIEYPYFMVVAEWDITEQENTIR